MHIAMAHVHSYPESFLLYKAAQRISHKPVSTWVSKTLSITGVSGFISSFRRQIAL